MQQAIRFPDKNGQWRGGARKGAGRKKRGRFASERHGKRPELTGREPVLSTAVAFDGWLELGAHRRFEPPSGYEPLPTHEARSWLLRTGWTKHGLIAAHEVPGPARGLA